MNKRKYRYVYDIRLEEEEYKLLRDLLCGMDFEGDDDEALFKEIKTKFQYPEKSKLEEYLEKEKS